MGDTTIEWPRLTAELWRGGELFASTLVEVVVNDRNYVALSAEVHVGAFPRASPHFTWIVRREDGSLFERHWQVGFSRRRGSETYFAAYGLHMSEESFSSVISDPLARRDLVRRPRDLEWRREGALA